MEPRRTTVAVCSFLLIAAVMPATAATTSLTGPFPITIDTPGSYRLDVDIIGYTGPGGDPISPITITSGGVKLDLEGHDISGYCGSLCPAILVQPGDPIEKVKISGPVSITGFGQGIAATRTTKLTISGVSVANVGNQGILLADVEKTKVSKSDVRFTTLPIVVEGSKSVKLLRNTVEGGAQCTYGISLGIAEHSEHSKVSRNIVSGCSVHGIYVGAGAHENAIVGNEVASSFANGITLADAIGNDVKKNSLHDNARGIVVGGSFNRIVANQVQDNSAEGIWTQSGATQNRLTKNVASGNGTDGVEDNAGDPCPNEWKKNELGTTGGSAASCILD